MNEWLINEQIKLHNPVADGELEVNWWKVKAPSVCARNDQVKEKKNVCFLHVIALTKFQSQR